MTKIKTAVLGATGYAGQELVRLLAQHPDVQLTGVTSMSYAGQKLTDVFPHLKGHVQLHCVQNDIESIVSTCDCIFLALPHGAASRLLTTAHLEQTRVVDLSGDFRFKDHADYEQWYQAGHGNPALNQQAVYGLSEWNSEAIEGAGLVANPGCYATAVSLALLPLVKADAINCRSVIVDAKSGVSGAGRGTKQAVHFNESNETLKAYSLTGHKHTGEIEEQLHQFAPGAVINFTPHVVPMNRGILATSYADLNDGFDAAAVRDIFDKQYADAPFVRLYGDGQIEQLPETRWVKGSNFCDIGFAVDERTNRVIVVSALDNLVKGAAGQAVQNMNLMFGIEETRGLTQIPLFPG
ncbi:MAG TPA: N-acetyl-gamma-glutamyl-phosphate reductase [Candidatus Obscuribacterales bacterium]